MDRTDLEDLVVGSGVLFVESKTNRIEPTALNGNAYSKIAIGDFDDNRLDDIFLWDPATENNRTALATLFDTDPFVISTNDIEPTAVNGNDFDQVIPLFSDATGPDTTGLFFWGATNQRSRMAMPIVPPLNPVDTMVASEFAIAPVAESDSSDSTPETTPLALDLNTGSEPSSLDEVFTDFDALLN